MSYIPDDRKLVLINIPGTHDSAAYCMNCIGAHFSTTQYLTIKQQLEIGVRKFDFRITSIDRNKEQNEDIICCHGICDCYVSYNLCDQRKLTYKSILLDIKNFLKKNPSETVMVSTFLGRGHFKNIIRAYEILDYEVGDIAIYYDPNILLGECRGRIIITTYLDNEVDKKRIKKVTTRSKSMINGTGIDEIHKKYNKNCKTYEIDGTLKITEINDFLIEYNMTLEQAEIEQKKNQSLFPITYSISCTGENEYVIPYPLGQAFIVNSYIKDKFRKGYYYGWLNIDFVNLEIASKLIASNFK